MDINWMSKIKKRIAKVFLGAMMIVQVVISSADVFQTGILKTEVAQEQADMHDGGLSGSSVAAGKLPGEEDDRAGLRPCGDTYDEKEAIKGQ